MVVITEELCGVEISKSTVSRLCEGLDVRLKVFNERRLDGHKFPFVLVDAMSIKARGEDRVQSKAVHIASRIDAKGYRHVRSLAIGDSESGSTWGEFFKALKDVVWLGWSEPSVMTTRGSNQPRSGTFKAAAGSAAKYI